MQSRSILKYPITNQLPLTNHSTRAPPQADPINGFVPETMDFARMVEADEQAFAAPASGGAATPGGGDPALHALHAKLRVDYKAWEESPIDVLKEHGAFIFIPVWAIGMTVRAFTDGVVFCLSQAFPLRR